MKKAFVFNKILIISFITLAALHFLILIKIVSPEILWDDTLNDYHSVVLSEFFTLAFLLPLIWLYRLSFKYIQTKRGRKLLIRILRLALFYFTLEFIGALLGTGINYKLFSSLTYLYLIIITVETIYSTSQIKKSKSRRFRLIRSRNSII